MKFKNPGFEDITLAYESPIQLGERCTRVCYRSEHLMKEGSAAKLIGAIARSGHGAMLEHIPVYLKLELRGERDDFPHEIWEICKSPYTRKAYGDDLSSDAIYASTNLRVIYENSERLFNEFMDHEGMPFDAFGTCSSSMFGPLVRNCSFDEYPGLFSRRITVLFDMDRIGSQSFCRHRILSFAQESTRRCNYLKAAFGSEISISTPCWLKDIDREEFVRDMETIEKLYFKWLDKGYDTEEARYFLPFGLSTKIVMTGFADAWEHFFDLRCEEHAHEQARELAIPLREHFIEVGYIKNIENKDTEKEGL